MGVTMFLALTGDEPWPGASEAQIVHQATTAGVPRLSETGLAIAPAVEAIVARACHKDPDARYPNALEMLEAIEELGRHTGWIASHVEVAALVDKLLGRELAARRAAILRARGRSVSSTPEALSVTMRERSRELDESRPSRSRRAVILASFIGGGVLSLGAAALFARGPRAERTVASATHEAPSSTTSASAAVTSAQATSAPPTSAQPASPTSATTSASVPTSGSRARPHARAEPRPAAPAPPPAAPTPAPAPAPPAAPPAEPPAAPAAPTAISTANPYR
jgi:hypothetical protein